MSTERQEELAALHAFGLLEGTERDAFVSELAANPELRALSDSLAGSAATVAFTAPPIDPPAGLRARILAAADQPTGTGQVISFPLLKFAPWAVAAALAIAVTWFASQNLTLRRENLTLRSERQLAEVAYKMAQNQLSERSLLAEKMIAELGTQLRQSEDLTRLKVTALASLAGNTKEAQAVAVWNPAQQSGLLTIEKLPAIAATQDYQIWIVDPAYPNPVNGGVFQIGPDGRVALGFKPDQPVAQVAAFAISLERKGGVPKAEGPIVLLGK
jgi:anti-sigma-K factor RskA